jgi:Fe-S cluster assembly scaffold protein SufB
VKPKSLDEVDPKLLATYEKLGIPLKEQMILAGVEGAEDRRGRKVPSTRCSIRSRWSPPSRKSCPKAGVIFCSISEAIREHPELVKKYLGSVVPVTDNYYATLNSAVFSDGSFVYVPPGVRCPMELSTYFRINAKNTGQFERTLIIADKGSTSPISKAAPRRSATRTSCMPPWSSWSRWKMPRSSIRPCRTGIRATRTARAASTTSSPSAPIAAATGPR